MCIRDRVGVASGAGPSGVRGEPGVFGFGVGVGVARGLTFPFGLFLTLQFFCAAWTVLDALHFCDTGFTGVLPSEASARRIANQLTT